MTEFLFQKLTNQDFLGRSVFYSTTILFILNLETLEIIANFTDFWENQLQGVIRKISIAIF